MEKNADGALQTVEMILVAKTLQYFAILAEIALNSGSGLIFALVKQPSFMVRATGIG